jgi:DNA modification methylase
MTTTQKLVWHTVAKKVNDLIPQDINPRIITDKQMSDLKKSLNKYNLVEIPAIDLNGKILAGHQRIKALQLLGRGEEMIDVRLPNRELTEDEAKQYLIASNALGGDWDFSALKSFDLDLLLDVGFDEIELTKFWDKDVELKDDPIDIEKEVKKAQGTDIKAGDMFQMGRHRLICGSSLELSNVQKLMGDVKADMVNDDVPFNIGLSYDKGVGNKQNYGGTINDSKSDDEYKIFIKTIMQNALSVTKKDAHIMFWGDERYVWLLQTLYKELGVDSKRLLVWIKNNSSPTPTVAFNKVTEFCAYGTIGSPYLSKEVNDLNEIQNHDMTTGNNLFEEIMDQLNIWMVKRLPSNQYSHPTEKSPLLHHKALRRCTKVGDVVLDLTAGSGSILIACEQLKRTAYLCELEPVFCQVILNRYKKFTGLNPIKLNEEK